MIFNKKKLVFLGGIVVLLLLFGVQTVNADTTSTLRPVADGGDDSASWSNTGGTACNATGCYLEVDESAGSSCTDSDGDTSFIEASANGANQTFDIDISSIPDGATISQIDITVCQKRVGSAPPNKFQTRKCVDGVCSNFGTDNAAAGNYTEVTQSHAALSILKTATTDLEVGVSITDTKDKLVRISQISAIVTYTIPGEPGEPAAVETVRVCGGNSPTKIIFSGTAYPGATLGVYLAREEWGVLQQAIIDGEFNTENDGSFHKEIISPVEERRVYVLRIKDKDGKEGRSKVFTYDTKFNRVINQENIFFAPTLSLSKPAVSRGELLLISGYAAPGNKVESLFDGKVTGEVKAEDGGLYRILIDTGQVALGNYKVQIRQVGSENEKVNEMSESKILRVSSFSFTLIDFNGDNKIDIQDWSVFLNNWSAKDAVIKAKSDLNGDGKADVSDFSVFLTNFQLGNR